MQNWIISGCCNNTNLPQPFSLDLKALAAAAVFVLLLHFLINCVCAKYNLFCIRFISTPLVNVWIALHCSFDYSIKEVGYAGIDLSLGTWFGELCSCFCLACTTILACRVNFTKLSTESDLYIWHIFARLLLSWLMLKFPRWQWCERWRPDIFLVYAVLVAADDGIVFDGDYFWLMHRIASFWDALVLQALAKL